VATAAKDFPGKVGVFEELRPAARIEPMCQFEATAFTLGRRQRSPY
jgi:hypothetical protein